MDFSVSVSPEQLFAGAEQLRAMSDDCAQEPQAIEDIQPASTREAGVDASAIGMRTATNAMAAAYRRAWMQACETVAATADTLQATARDYQQVEQEIAELVMRLLNQDEQPG